MRGLALPGPRQAVRVLKCLRWASLPQFVLAAYLIFYYSWLSFFAPLTALPA
jgi:hypothetical protein